MTTDEAAARVARFCDEFVKSSQYHPDHIYTLGRVHGDYTLAVSDLRLLLEAAKR